MVGDHPAHDSDDERDQSRELTDHHQRLEDRVLVEAVQMPEHPAEPVARTGQDTTMFISTASTAPLPHFGVLFNDTMIFSALTFGTVRSKAATWLSFTSF